MDSLVLFAQTTMQSEPKSSGTGIIIGVIAGLIAIVTMWRVFQKAGQPGWAAIIPIYNLYILLKVVGRPGWWMLLYLIPLVNVVVHIVVSIDLAKAFGKDTAFGVIGLWLFSLIGMLILAFGDATYKGAPKHA
jgi:hypothetical protein